MGRGIPENSDVANSQWPHQSASFHATHLWWLPVPRHCRRRAWRFSNHVYKLHSPKTRSLRKNRTSTLLDLISSPQSETVNKGTVHLLPLLPSTLLSGTASQKLGCAPHTPCHWPDLLSMCTSTWNLFLLSLLNRSLVNTTSKEVLQIPLCSSNSTSKFHIACFFLILVFHTFSNIFYEISALLGWERKALWFQSILSVTFTSTGKKKYFSNSRWLFSVHY